MAEVGHIPDSVLLSVPDQLYIRLSLVEAEARAEAETRPRPAGLGLVSVSRTGLRPLAFDRSYSITSTRRSRVRGVAEYRDETVRSRRCRLLSIRLVY